MSCTVRYLKDSKCTTILYVYCSLCNKENYLQDVQQSHLIKLRM